MTLPRRVRPPPKPNAVVFAPERVLLSSGLGGDRQPAVFEWFSRGDEITFERVRGRRRAAGLGGGPWTRTGGVIAIEQDATSR